jgi:hypothetical protein
MSGKLSIACRTAGPEFFILLLFLFLLPGFLIHAQEGLPDSVITKRLLTIQKMLDQGKTNANRWWVGWLAGYSAATVVQTSVLLVSDEIDTRQDMALGAATTFLGAAGQIIAPLGPRYMPNNISRLPQLTREEKMLKLTEMEDLLRKNASREKIGKSWKTHMVCSAVNLGSGLITWIGFDRNVWAGLGNFALNTAITEAQIFTQPRRAMRDFEQYQRYCKGDPSQSYRRLYLSWSVNVYAGRVAIRVLF